MSLILSANTRNICLLGASFGTNNMGVGALAAGTIQSITNGIPKANIWFLDYGREGSIYRYVLDEGEIAVRLINMRFSKNVFLQNHILYLIFLTFICNSIFPRKLRSNIIESNDILHKLSEADMVLALSGGDSFSDIYGFKRFIYVSFPQILSLLLKKKLILLPQTLGPFKNFISRNIAKYIMKNAYIVYSRDHIGLAKSRSLVDREDSKGKMKFCYDVGFVVPPRKPLFFNLKEILEKNRKNKFFVGLNVSGLLYMGGYNQRNMFGLIMDYREIILQIIDLVISKFDAEVILIPHVFGSNENRESDVNACESVYEEMKNRYPGKVFLLEGLYDQNEIKYVIGLCDYFIGSRMHACIAAISQGIPTVSIAYSNKFLGVFEPIGCAKMVLDLRTLNQKQILDVIVDIYNERDIIKSDLMKKMPEIRKKIFTIFSEFIFNNI